MLKVLFVIDKMAVGGAQRHLSLLIPRLLDRGVDAHLACLDSGGPMIGEIPVNRVSEWGVGKIYGARALVKFPGFVAMIARGGFHVVHTFLFSANIYGVLAAEFAGAPVIVTSRRSMPIGRARRHFMALEMTGAFVDAVTVNSRDMVDVVSFHENLARSKIRVIYNGVEPFEVSESERKKNRASLGAHGDEVVVGLLARFRPSKDHATFVRAAARLAGTFPALRFVCVGDGETRAATEALARSLGVADRFVFAGERADSRAICAAFDIGVFSSVAEGFPNALLELMTAGRPVVATNISGNNEGVRDGVNGFLFAPGDNEAMAHWIGMLAGNGALRAAMGAEARVIARREYSLEKMTRDYHELHMELLAGKGVAF